MPYRILVVDDDPPIRRLLSFLLSDASHTVETAADGVEALEHLQSAPPDLLLLDLNMPRLGGLDVLRQLPNLAAPPTVDRGFRATQRPPRGTFPRGSGIRPEAV
jgi:CheY-like chemotaxis protein